MRACAHFHGPTPVEDNPKSQKMAYLQGLWGIVFLFLIKNLVRLVRPSSVFWDGDRSR